MRAFAVYCCWLAKMCCHARDSVQNLAKESNLHAGWSRSGEWGAVLVLALLAGASFCSKWNCDRSFPSAFMSSSHPRQPPAHDAARTGSRPTSAADSELPEFQPHAPSPYTPMDREIERSERASAALAAARALARASFTDSQLAAEEAAGHDDLDDVASSWARTEYVAFDPTPQSDAAQEPPPRNLVGGSFNPGIASQQGRLFPGASIGDAPIRTRSGAMARFAQESRHAPRGDRGSRAAPPPGPAPFTANYKKPAVMPVLAPARPPVAPKARPARRSASHEPARFLLAAVLGAAVVLVGGGFAWNAGLLSRQPDELALVTPKLAAQAEAARLLSESRNIAIDPAAGPAPQRSDAEVDAALAAAARAAAVPADSVRAAGPALLVQPPPAGTAPSAAAARASAVRHVAPLAKEDVDAAVANARARADRFLAPAGAGSAVAPVSPTETTRGH